MLGSRSQLICLHSDVLSEPHQAFFERGWPLLSHGTLHTKNEMEHWASIGRRQRSPARPAIPQEQSLQYETKSHFSYGQNIAARCESRHTNFHIRKTNAPAPRSRARCCLCSGIWNLVCQCAEGGSWRSASAECTRMHHHGSIRYHRGSLVRSRSCGNGPIRIGTVDQQNRCLRRWMGAELGRSNPLRLRPSLCYMISQTVVIGRRRSLLSRFARNALVL